MDKAFPTISRMVQWCLYILGSALILLAIASNWSEPSLKGFEGKALEAEGVLEIWLVRLLYIHWALVAVYCEWARNTESGRFPPYNLFVMLLVALAPMLVVIMILK